MPTAVVTEVMSPPEFVSVSISFAQPQVAPFHFSTWPTAHVLSSDSMTLPVTPPPVSPPAGPTVTPVIPVPPTSAEHTHAVPLHLRIWFIAQVCVSESVISPEVPPPESPFPANTAVTSPDPDRSGAQVTVPSALTPMMKLSDAHVPVTRFCTSWPAIPPTASAFAAWIA